MPPFLANLIAKIPSRKPGAAVARPGSVRIRNLVRPTPRPLAEWLGIGLLVAMLIAAFMSVLAGYRLSSASGALGRIDLKLPVFESYIVKLGPGAVGKVPPEKKQETPKSGEGIRGLVEQGFRSISQFENGRAEFRLRNLRAELVDVFPDSAASAAGLQRGDVIVNVNGRPAGFVWDVLKSISSLPLERAEIEIRRGDVGASAVLSPPKGGALDTANSGLLFAMPDGLHFIGETDLKALSEQFNAAFLEQIPVHWRKSYATSFAAVARRLVGYTLDQAGRPSSDAGFLKVDAILLWHHDAFLEQIERFEIERRQALERQSAALQSFASRMMITMLLVMLLGALALFTTLRGNRPARPEA